MSSDITVGLKEKCQSGVHKSSGVINRLTLEGRLKKDFKRNASWVSTRAVA